MPEPKIESLSPVESAADLDEKKAEVTVTSAPDHCQLKSSHSRWDAVKSMLLAKTPIEGAPLEYGGHRTAEEPTKKLGVGGVLAKFARFFGPGMILTVAYIDPDNFQTSVSDGQDFGYKMLFMVFFSLVVAIYLQVSRRVHVWYYGQQLTA
jgi:hypothetical protein